MYYCTTNTTYISCYNRVNKKVTNKITILLLFTVYKQCQNKVPLIFNNLTLNTKFTCNSYRIINF